MYSTGYGVSVAASQGQVKSRLLFRSWWKSERGSPHGPGNKPHRVLTAAEIQNRSRVWVHVGMGFKGTTEKVFDGNTTLDSPGGHKHDCK